MLNPSIFFTGFQTFFVSRQEVSTPIIGELMRIKKILYEEYSIMNPLVLSIGFGSRIIINSAWSEEEFIEIVDYDPIRNIVLVIGRSEPHEETPLHWMIHRAREDIHVIIEILNTEVSETLKEKIHSTGEIKKYSPLDYIKKVLKTLGRNNSVIIEGQSVLFTGNNVREIMDNIRDKFGCEKT